MSRKMLWLLNESFSILHKVVDILSIYARLRETSEREEENKRDGEGELIVKGQKLLARLWDKNGEGKIESERKNTRIHQDEQRLKYPWVWGSGVEIVYFVHLTTNLMQANHL